MPLVKSSLAVIRPIKRARVENEGEGRVGLSKKETNFMKQVQ